MKEEFKQYKVEDPGSLWLSTWRYGDGYDVMGVVEKRGWRVISGWGARGYDLGSWPYVMVYFQEKDGKYHLVEYCEGDVVMYSCPTEEIRSAITDEIAFWHWKHNDNSWVKGYTTVEELPTELRGPYRD